MHRFSLVRQASACAALSCFTSCAAHAQNIYGFRITELHDGAKVSPTDLNPPAASKRRLIRVVWDASPGAGSAPSGAPGPNGPFEVAGGYQWNYIERDPDDEQFPISIGANNVLTCDDSNWDYNTTVRYTLVGTQYGWAWNSSTNTWGGTSTSLTFPIYVTVRRVAATDAQTVDTRVDPRFSTYQLKEYKFGTNKYRGGLFAGFNADGAKVARSYFKFTNLVGPPTSIRGVSNQLWWIGGLSLYLTRTAQASQTPSLIARFVADDTWNPTTLAWSNAPAFASSGGSALSLPWTANDPGRWISFDVLPLIQNSLVANGGDGTLSLAVAAPGETNDSTSATFPLSAANGWAYFGRAGYKQDGVTDIAPYLLYAYGGYGTDINSIGVGLSYDTSTMPPTAIPIHPGNTKTGTVTLATAAPAGGVVVALLSSDTAKLSVPATVTIAGGQQSATFTVTGGTITASGSVTISATLGKTVTTTVPVAP